MIQYRKFHIHGDNIVECERVFDLVKTALSNWIISTAGPLGSPVCPTFQVRLRNMDSPLSFTFFPGFGRWNENILQFIRERGGILREAADVIITGVSSEKEEPLLAIEFCGALPAGNQAWQRSGRAYSFGLATIPYLYVAELGGYELDAKRKRKSPRMPNPAVPFSYLSYSLEQNIPVLPVFITSPGADKLSRKAYADVFANDELFALIRGILLNEDVFDTYELLRHKVLAFVKKRAEGSRRMRTLTPQQWEHALANVQAGYSLVDYLVNSVRLPWSKTAYIDSLTNTAKALMSVATKYGIGLTASDLPFCIIPQESRSSFVSSVSQIYGALPKDFIQWLTRDEHLVICWVMGFKPRGDDARPDRGLPPFARMLIGHGYDLLSVVYGPAPESAWSTLEKSPGSLAERNGLWESIMAVSDAIFVDSATDTITSHGFLRSHWERAIIETPGRSILVTPIPTRLGENDVDTVLHVLLAHHAGQVVYEGMCNPPGGDWSGVSLNSEDRSLELRWLSLPRVSGEDSKRPDHVFQLFGIASKTVVLTIESKETARAVESHIGPRLTTYVSSLIASTASIERAVPSKSWVHSSHQLNPENFLFASAVAFISNSDEQIQSVISKAQVDLVFAYTFRSDGKLCHIQLVPDSMVGKVIADYIAQLDLSNTGISVVVAT